MVDWEKLRAATRAALKQGKKITVTRVFDEGFSYPFVGSYISVEISGKEIFSINDFSPHWEKAVKEVQRIERSLLQEGAKRISKGSLGYYVDEYFLP